MPLLAIVDDEPIVSVLLDDDVWAQLGQDVREKRCSLLLPCGSPGHTRVSKLGTRHFAHNPGGDGCSAGETAEHLLAKAMIVRAAAEAGWTAQPEARGEGWVADVLATSPAGIKVVFEVQWSRQDLAEYERRQSRYLDAGIGAVAWFARHAEVLPSPRRDLPIFRLAVGKEPVVQIGDHEVGIAEVVKALLGRRLQHREYLTGRTSAAVSVARDECWKCKKPFAVWSVDQMSVTGPCATQRTQAPPQAFFPTTRIEEHPAVRDVAASVAKTLSVRVARLESRFTKISGVTYRAFVCPFCNAVAGEVFIQRRLDESSVERSCELVSVPLPFQHWCLATDGSFCAEPPAPLVGWIKERDNASRIEPVAPIGSTVGLHQSIIRRFSSY